MSLHQHPDLFVNVVVAPAASPWDQHRAARMRADLGAPLPADQVEISIRRLGRWSSGAGGRFAVGYMRSALVVAEERRTVEVEGQSITFIFQDPTRRFVRRRAALVDGVLAVGAIFSLSVAALKWTAVHEATLDDLHRRAQIASHDLLDRRLAAREAQNLVVLRRNDLLGRNGQHAINDLAWLSAVRDPQAPLKTVTWSDGRLEVTTVSGGPPTATAQRAGGSATWSVQAPQARPVGRGPSVVSRRPIRQAAP
jgi:hypothetical protein